MTEYTRKRGYVKWTDENGKKHKVREEDFDTNTLVLTDDDLEESDGDVPSTEND